jgi:hypothetical protein
MGTTSRFPSPTGHRPVRSSFDMSFPRPPAPIRPPSSGQARSPPHRPCAAHLARKASCSVHLRSRPKMTRSCRTAAIWVLARRWRRDRSASWLGWISLRAVNGTSPWSVARQPQPQPQPLQQQPPPLLGFGLGIGVRPAPLLLPPRPLPVGGPMWGGAGLASVLASVLLALACRIRSGIRRRTTVLLQCRVRLCMGRQRRRVMARDRKAIVGGHEGKGASFSFQI